MSAPARGTPGNHLVPVRRRATACAQRPARPPPSAAIPGPARTTWRYPWTAPTDGETTSTSPTDPRYRTTRGCSTPRTPWTPTASDDPLDRGWSPPERPWAVERYGRDRRRAPSAARPWTSASPEEVPDIAEPDGDGIGDCQGTDGEPLDNEVGDLRSGRLVAPERRSARGRGERADRHRRGHRRRRGLGRGGRDAHRRRGLPVRLTGLTRRPPTVAHPLPRQGALHAAGQAARLPPRRLPRPRRRLRLPHPVHRDQRPDDRLGRRRDVPRRRRRDLLGEPPLLHGQGPDRGHGGPDRPVRAAVRQGSQDQAPGGGDAA